MGGSVWARSEPWDGEDVDLVLDIKAWTQAAWPCPRQRAVWKRHWVSTDHTCSSVRRRSNQRKELF